MSLVFSRISSRYMIRIENATVVCSFQIAEPRAVKPGVALTSRVGKAQRTTR